MNSNCLDIANAAGLKQARTVGKEVLFHCPRHNDADPSLSINLEKNCFLCGPCAASGTAWAFAAFLSGLNPSDKKAVASWLRERGLLNGNTGVRKISDKRIVTTYPYCDRDGKLLFEVVRFEPKDFRQRRPDGNGGWIYNREGVKPVLYRLPELLSAELSKTIFVLEGEKDVDALMRLGLVATCNPGGAGKWRDEYSQDLRGRSVVVLPDNDDAGRKHAEQVGRSLLGLVASLKKIDLPGLEPKGDVSDWLTCGNTVEQLQNLAGTAPEWTLANPPSNTEASIDNLMAQSGVDDIGPDTNIDEVETALRKLGSLVQEADPLRRRAVREESIRRLKLAGTGIQSVSTLVDAALQPDRPFEDDSKSGKSIVLSEPEPWPDPCNGAELLDEIRQVFKRFVVLPEGGAELLSLFVVHTYAIDAAWISPILSITSPEKRCGKTLVLELLGSLVNRPLPTVNVSEAALFRAVEQYRPTLLIDEADTFVRQRDELRGILNASHQKGSARVIRTVGDEHEPRTFNVWCAKAIAGIGDLPDSLGDRSISIRMRRKSPQEKVERLRRDQMREELEPLRRKAARFAKDHSAALQSADPEVPASLNDRAQDNWRPLLAIAEEAGGPWPERARKTAMLLSGDSRQSDASAAIQLLADIRTIFHQQEPNLYSQTPADRLSSEDIVRGLQQMEDRPWPEWKNSKPITTAQLARLLKRFDIGPKQIWIGDKNVRGYNRDDFADVFSRYLPPLEPLDPLELHTGTGLKAFSTSPESGCSSTLGFPASHSKQNLLAGLAVQRGDVDGAMPSDGRSKGDAGWRTGPTVDDCAAGMETIGGKAVKRIITQTDKTVSFEDDEGKRWRYMQDYQRLFPIS